MALLSTSPAHPARHKHSNCLNYGITLYSGLPWKGTEAPRRDLLVFAGAPGGTGGPPRHYSSTDRKTSAAADSRARASGKSAAPNRRGARTAAIAGSPLTTQPHATLNRRLKTAHDAAQNYARAARSPPRPRKTQIRNWLPPPLPLHSSGFSCVASNHSADAAANFQRCLSI